MMVLRSSREFSRFIKRLLSVSLYSECFFPLREIIVSFSAHRLNKCKRCKRDARGSPLSFVAPLKNYGSDGTLLKYYALPSKSLCHKKNNQFVYYMIIWNLEIISLLLYAPAKIFNLLFQ